MKVALASDHAGFELKIKIMHYLQELGIEIKDLGDYVSEPDDYPDYGHKLASYIEDNKSVLGISLCGSGNGINMTANKHPGIRSALCWNSEIAALARQHNDANICALPARFLTFEQATQIVDAFLNASFEGGRHKRRIDKIPR